MAMTKLGNKAAGSTVKIKVNGTAREWIVVHQGRPSTLYDASCDGTWLLMKDIYEKRQWHSSNVNDYANSTIHNYLNSTFRNLIDPNIRSQIKQVKIPYRAGSGYGTTITSGANGLATNIFLLSGKEVGLVHSQIPSGEGVVLDYFQGCIENGADSKRVATLNGATTDWWIRSPCCGSTYGASFALYVTANGNRSNTNCTNSGCGIRPVMILPKDMMVSDDGTVSANTAPTTPSSLSVPSQINGGSTITIEWGAASDAESNLEGYELQRSLDGGSTWSNVYLGSARSTTNTVPFGTETVMYRVRAYDSAGLYSAYRTGSQVTVINNTAPSVPDGITVPEQVQGGQPLTITWGGSVDDQGNLAGYSLERSVNGGAWEAVYSGPERGFTDFITKGWLTVDYRVRAYDSANAYSGFAAAESRTVNNNTPAVITCEHPANVSLGVKSEDFTVAYTVEDEEGDGVTVTESVDGTALRTFAVELGQPNTLTLGGVDFMRLLNGNHTLAIAADDGASSAVYQLPFTKLVTAASVTLAQPMEADGPISVCVLSVSGSIPAGAALSVQVTNNALDDAPVWEDCTAIVRAGGNVIFENKTAEKGFAFNFRLHVERGASGLGGYITSVQGGFQ